MSRDCAGFEDDAEVDGAAAGGDDHGTAQHRRREVRNAQFSSQGRELMDCMVGHEVLLKRIAAGDATQLLSQYWDGIGRLCIL